MSAFFLEKYLKQICLFLGPNEATVFPSHRSPPAEVRLYFQAWREAKASRRPVKHLAELKTSKAGSESRRLATPKKVAW